MPHPVLDNLRQKFPGAYDDLDDRALAEKLAAKKPEYADVLADLVASNGAPGIESGGHTSIGGTNAAAPNRVPESGATTPEQLAALQPSEDLPLSEIAGQRLANARGEQAAYDQPPPNFLRRVGTSLKNLASMASGAPGVRIAEALSGREPVRNLAKAGQETLEAAMSVPSIPTEVLGDAIAQAASVTGDEDFAQQAKRTMALPAAIAMGGAAVGAMRPGIARRVVSEASGVPEPWDAPPPRRTNAQGTAEPPTAASTEAPETFPPAGDGRGQVSPAVPPGAGPSAAAARPRGPFASVVDRTAAKLNETAESFERLDRRAEIALEEAPAIEETGTLGKPARREFREGGSKPETYGRRFSEQEVAESSARLTETVREWKQVHRTIREAGDPGSRLTAQTVDAMLQRAVNDWNGLRFAAGRSVGAFRKPVDPELLHTLREAGHLLDGLREAQPRVPIYTNLLRAARNITRLSPEEWKQAGRDAIDAFRLNLFSVTSFSLDMIGNAAEIGSRTAGGVGRDLYSVGTGKLNFPSLQGLFRAIRDARRLPEKVKERLGRQTASGEILPGLDLRGPGAFTERSNPASAAIDYAVGAPLYAKGIVDTSFKRFGAAATLWRDAIEEANRRGLRGLERRRFYQDFWQKPPRKSLEEAIEVGKKAGFDRDLSAWEERLAGSKMYQLFGAAFGRWPFQFVRTMGEWLGADPSIVRQIRQGTLHPAAVAAYLTRSATGWGGLWLLNDLYDSVDFGSMEYVHEDGSRTRLSGREPLATGLWLLATIKGDESAALAALKYASIPGAGFVTGEGGLVTGMLKAFQRAHENANADPRAISRELTNVVNRAIPGQAILSALKTIFDETAREGVGANLPGISRMKPARVNVTTGEDLKPRQRIPGLDVELPAIGGVPIPGAQRVTDPVFNLLSRYGLMTYRGMRQPVAGVPAADIPKEWRSEWERALGRNRQELLRPLAEGEGSEDGGELADQIGEAIAGRVLELFGEGPSVEQATARRPNPESVVERQRTLRAVQVSFGRLKKPLEALSRGDQLPREDMRKLIQGVDAIAARLATAELRETHGVGEKPPRQLTRRERTGPRRFLEQEEEEREAVAQ